jgi:hypothetical protein
MTMSRDVVLVGINDLLVSIHAKTGRLVVSLRVSPAVAAILGIQDSRFALLGLPAEIDPSIRVDAVIAETVPGMMNCKCWYPA